jgi:GAF domain-containing protein
VRASGEGVLPLAEELSAVFARMSGLLLSEETVDTALRLVTSLATDTVPGAVGAGVTLVGGAGRRTAAASDNVVQLADELQYDLDEGPCLTAWATRASVRIDDVADDDRWPRWCASVESLSVRSVLSAPMVAGDLAIGAIKVYSDRERAFDERAEHLLAMFAAQAAILLVNVQTHQAATRLSEGLKEALRSRDLISTAKGILMARSGVGEETGLATLVAMAQRGDRTLRDTADEVVRSTARRLR